ncbi:MAG TPA: ATP-binding protein [Candidatus Angelobacter sp.]|nr:ATP-binding protein [Candidatus Angelobacter sp.]
MQPTIQRISGRVNAAILDKADRLFRNDDAGIWTELLQNARRAGATVLEISVEELTPASGPCRIVVHDNGRGIENFQSLLTLGSSEWEAETQVREDPAGMGFFSLCRSEVQVHSGNRSVWITPNIFMGKGEAHVTHDSEFIAGTRLSFVRESTKDALVTALKKVSEFCPLEVRLDGSTLPRHDFLDGAFYRETIDGIEVGFTTEFTWAWIRHHDSNWNFYGARIEERFDSFTGLLRSDHPLSPLSVFARFNVLETGRVKLQLPDRRAIIQDEFLAEFYRKARAAAYRAFQKHGAHVLPFRNWKEASELGVRLPEAVCLLETWCADPADQHSDPAFESSETRLLSDASGLLIVERDLPDSHTLDGALHSGAVLEWNLYREEPKYKGYSWYDRLPRITSNRILLDEVPWEDWSAKQERPASISVELTIEQEGVSQLRRLPALIHVDTSEWHQLSFAAVRQSPWDNDDLRGPFDICEFLLTATFCASDDADSDSWETQRDYHKAEIERAVNWYFRSPRAVLTTLLGKALNWEARKLAEEMGIREIRFKRTANGSSWQSEVVE